MWTARAPPAVAQALWPATLNYDGGNVVETTAGRCGHACAQPADAARPMSRARIGGFTFIGIEAVPVEVCTHPRSRTGGLRKGRTPVTGTTDTYGRFAVGWTG